MLLRIYLLMVIMMMRKPVMTMTMVSDLWGNAGDDEDVVCGDEGLSLLMGRPLMTPLVPSDYEWHQ